MKYCTSCGKELNDQDLFCTGCGKKCDPIEMPVIPPVEEPVAPPIEEPVAPPVVEPVAPPVEEPVAPPVEEPVAPPVVEPVAPPIEEPVAPPIVEPVAPPVEEPVAPPIVEPVAPPVEEPVAAPAEKAPAKEPETQAEKAAKKAAKPAKKKVVLFSVLGALLTLILIAAVIFLAWYNSAEQRILRALEDGDYNTAIGIIAEDSSAGESESLVEELKTQIENIQQEFVDGTLEYAAAKMKLENMGRLNISGIQADLRETNAYIDDLNDSRTDFATAESFFATGDYAEAIEYYGRVIEEDANYATAVDKLAQAVNLYREERLGKASEYAKQALYTDAISLLDEALKVIPNDTALIEQIRIYTKDNVEKVRNDALKTAAAFAEDGDPLNAFKTLKALLNTEVADAQVTAAHKKYCEQYVEKVVREADALAGEKDYTGATNLLRAALQELPADPTITAKLEQIEAQKPVPLTSVTLVNGSWKWNDGSPVDPFGNDYSAVNNYAIFKRGVNTGSYNYMGYTEYRLYGKYETLTFSLAPHKDIGENDDALIQVYVDDVLTYTSPQVVRKTDMMHCQVNVAGAEYIKIEVHLSYNGAMILSDAKLWP